MLRLLLLVCALLACTHSPGPGRSQPRVVIRNRAGQELTVKVEVARTDPERARGLMYRQSLEDGRGMLFLFDRPARLSFWMKNTYIPLDMIFMDARRQLVGIEENAEPLTLTPRGPQVDSQFVLEVPGGWSRAHSVAPGAEARFLEID